MVTMKLKKEIPSKSPIILNIPNTDLKFIFKIILRVNYVIV